jgi:hypothetical protein
MNALQKLRSLVEDIRVRRQPLQLLDQWALAGRLLSRMPADQAAVAVAVRDKDLDALDAIVRRLEHPAPTAAGAPPAQAAPAFTAEELTKALHAFRKRLKLMRLSDESRLGNRYTTGGRTSNIDAIQPPSEFPEAIWKALAAEGKLKDTGSGFYAEP